MQQALKKTVCAKNQNNHRRPNQPPPGMLQPAKTGAC